MSKVKITEDDVGRRFRTYSGLIFRVDDVLDKCERLDKRCPIAVYHLSDEFGSIWLYLTKNGKLDPASKFKHVYDFKEWVDDEWL